MRRDDRKGDFKTKSFRSGGQNRGKSSGFGRDRGGFGKKTFGSKPFGERRSFSGPREERSFTPREDRPFAPREDRPREDRFNSASRGGDRGGYSRSNRGGDRRDRGAGFSSNKTSSFGNSGSFTKREDNKPSQGIVSIELINDGKIPQYMSLDASGMDVFSNEEVTLKGGSLTKVHTGIVMRSLPPRTVISIRSRSSLAKNGLLLISPTIMSHVDGNRELVFTFLNLTQEDKVIKKEDRIGQIVFNVVEKVFLEVADKLNATERGVGGFGSTGR